MADLRVHIACNDDRGNFAGEAYKVEIFQERDGDPLITLGTDCMEGSGIEMSWGENGVITIGKCEPSPFFGKGRTHWVGNMGWDATSMEASAVTRFVEKLIELGMQVEQWQLVEPWDRIAQADFDKRT